MDLGFSDPMTDEALPCVTDVDTPAATSNGTTDLVIVHMDTDQTLTTMALVTRGGTDTTAAKANLGTLAPSAATYQTVLIQCGNRQGYAVVDGDPVSKSAGLSTGPDTAVLMRPHFLYRTRNSSAKAVDIDYIRVWSERN
jgi:hypothetical protein